jgi:hypothetical protein
MTVPMNPETPHSEVSAGDHGSRPVAPRVVSRRKLMGAGVILIGLGVVALVLAFPDLAAPIGTSAGVIAAVVPLVQRVGRGGSSDGQAGEP